MVIDSTQIVLVIPFILIFIIAMFVSGLLIYYYLITKVFDYVLISVTFFVGAIYNLFLMFLKIDLQMDKLLHYQILHFCFITIQFFFFIYAIRVKWQELPILLTSVGVIWYLSILFFISQYQLIELPSETMWGMFTLRKTEEEIIGAAFLVGNDKILIGWGYDLLFSLYRIFAFVLIIYYYLTADFPVNDDSVRRSYQFWIVANVLYLLPALIKVPFHLSFYYLPNVRIIVSLITLLSLLTVAYIVFNHTEAVLLSSIQLLRARKIYQQVINQELSKEDVSFGLKKIIDYLNQLPNEFVEEVFEQKVKITSK